MNINGFGKSSKKKVFDFEQFIGFSLPEDYKKFLIRYNGGTPQVKYSTFTVEDLKTDISLDVLLGLGINKLDLKIRNIEYKEDLIPKCIIIGDDPGIGMIILINDDDIYGVYYWDHSFYFKQSNKDNNIYKISNSFQSFVDGLKNP